MKYVESYRQMAEFGRELLGRPELEKGIPLIMKYLKETIASERCSIFIYNFKLNLLWTIVAEGSRKIILSADQGIVGECVSTKKAIISNDPYNEEHFYADVDKKSGFKTENLACVPILASNGNVIGALELLNSPEGFTKEDTRFMKFFCGYISGYIELALMFEDETKYLYEDHYKMI